MIHVALVFVEYHVFFRDEVLHDDSQPSLAISYSMLSLHLLCVCCWIALRAVFFESRPLSAGHCVWRHAVLALDGAQPILADALRVRARRHVSRAHHAGAGARVAGRRVQLVAAAGIAAVSMSERFGVCGVWGAVISERQYGNILQLPFMVVSKLMSVFGLRANDDVFSVSHSFFLHIRLLITLVFHVHDCVSPSDILVGARCRRAPRATTCLRTNSRSTMTRRFSTTKTISRAAVTGRERISMSDQSDAPMGKPLFFNKV